jgi:hypothetical protein
MPFPRKAEFDALMHRAFALHALIQPQFRHQPDCPLLKHASPNRRFDPLPAAPFEDNRGNAFPREQERQH